MLGLAMLLSLGMASLPSSRKSAPDLIMKRITLPSFGTLPIVLLWSAPAPAHAFGPDTTPSEAFDSFHIGNSFTWGDLQMEFISGIANEMDVHHDMSWSIILGAGLQWIWENPMVSDRAADGETFTAGLAVDNRWEAVVLQHYPPEEDAAVNAQYAANFYRLALAGNRDCQAYLFSIWPDHAQMDDPPANRRLDFSQAIAREFNHLFPENDPIVVIPAGAVIQELASLADEGKLPGIENRLGLFKDAGHLNRIGSYAVAATHVACMFDLDPKKFPANPVYPPTHPLAGQTIHEMDAETSAVILQTVSDVIAAQAPAAVGDRMHSR